MYHLSIQLYIENLPHLFPKVQFGYIDVVIDGAEGMVSNAYCITSTGRRVAARQEHSSGV